jgi:hypothetical protein
VAGVLLQDHAVRNTEFQQLPYHRILGFYLLTCNPHHLFDTVCGIIDHHRLNFLFIIILTSNVLGHILTNTWYRGRSVITRPCSKKYRIPTVTISSYLYNAIYRTECTRTCTGKHQLSSSHSILVRYKT